MNSTQRHIALYSIRIFLMVFWLYVALDKLWNLQGFHLSLLKQPFPHWWADVLFWGLPLVELVVALLFIGRRFRTIAHLLSSLLMLAFTVYIGLGVAGAYTKRPCSCASVFRGMSWDTHLIVNIALLGISLYGYYLSRRRDGNGDRSQKRKSLPTLRLSQLWRRYASWRRSDTFSPIIILSIEFCKWYRRRFALFPGRPVQLSLNYTFAVVSSKTRPGSSTVRPDK